MYTSELWPTNIRHSMMGFCSTIGRIGAALAPMAPLLVHTSRNFAITNSIFKQKMIIENESLTISQSQYLEILPYLTFGMMSMIAAILILKLPETLRSKLPDTISEAEKIGHSESIDETS